MPAVPMPSDQRRQRAAESVVALAAERAHSQLTAAAIAGHMGLSHTALFKHFASRDAMLAAAIDWIGERLLARIDLAISQHPDPADALEAVLLTHLHFVAKHPGIPKLLGGELQRGGDRPAKRLAIALQASYHARLRPLLERGKTSGRFHPELDVAAAAVTFTGVVDALALQSGLAGGSDRIRLQGPGVISILLRGLRRSP